MQRSPNVFIVIANLGYGEVGCGPTSTWRSQAEIDVMKRSAAAKTPFYAFFV